MPLTMRRTTRCAGRRMRIGLGCGDDRSTATAGAGGRLQRI